MIFVRALALACIVVLALGAVAQAATRRPDLQVRSVGAPPSSQAAGGTVALSAKVKNAGPARAKASSTGFYLSRDARLSKDDVRLVRVKTKALKARRTVSVKRSVAVPVLLTGALRLIACADDAKKVRERKERNNCRTAKGTLTIRVTPPAVVPAGPPVASSATVSVVEDTSATLALVATDADTCDLVFAVTAAPAHGALGSLVAAPCAGGRDAATATYTPVADYAGPDAVGFRVADATAFSEAVIAITVTPVNDAPVNTVPASVFVPADESGPVDGIAVADIDSESLTVTLTGTNGTPSPASASGTPAQIAASLADVTFTPAGGFEGQASLKMETSDGALTDTDTIPITVAANHAPAVTATAGTLGYTENDAATPIDSGVTVSDADAPNLAGATVAITTAYAVGEDVLSLPLPPVGITSSFDAASGTLTLSGSATVAAYQDALRAVTYANTSEAPAAGLRTVTFTANDGFATGSATRNVSVASVNDSPVLASAAGDAAFTEGGTPVVIDGQLTIADADDTQLESGSIAIASPQAGEVLLLTDAAGDGITVTGSATPSITLTGTASLAAYRDVLRSATYGNPGSDLVDGTRTVNFAVNDGSAASNTLARGVAITANNTPPAISSTAVGDMPFTEGGAAVTIDNLITVSDEVGTLTRATVSVVSPQAGDTLEWADLNGGSAPNVDAVNTTATTLVLTGSASLVAYQDALRAVKYANSRTDLTNSTRTVSFVVRDEGLDSSAHTRNVAITAVDGPPAVTASGGSTAYTEQAASVVVDAALTAADADGGANPTGATVEILSPVAGDTLVYATLHGITGNFAAGTLTLSGAATFAQYQEALRSVQFGNSTSDAPGTSRTIRFRITTPVASNASDKTIAITAVNDLPVVNLDAPGGLAYSEQAGFVNLFGADATISDPDSAILDSLVVTFTSGFDATFDELRIHPVVTGFTVTPSAGQFTIVRTGGGTIAQYQAALRAVQFSNTDDDPDNRNDGTPDAGVNTRLVQVVADDGPATSTPVTRGITISPVNDPPGPPSPLPTTSGVRNTTLVAGTNSVTGPKVTRTVNLEGNATDPDGLESAIAVVPVTSATTVQSGRITLTAAGDIVYEPPASGSLASDTFAYMLTDGVTSSPSITFTVNLSGAVWYVADQAFAGADGTAARPFASVATAVAAASPSQAIHVRNGTGDGILSGSASLQAGQKLLGQGVALTNAEVGSATVETIFAAGTNPVLTANGTDVVTLAANAQVAGLSVNPDGAANGVVGSAVAGVTLRSMEINDSGIAASQPGLELSGVGNGLTLSGNVDVAMQSNRAVSINGAALSGTFTNVTTTASVNGGVHLTNTTGSLIFRNLALTTTASAAAAFLLSNAANIDVDGAGFAANIVAGGGPAVDAATLTVGTDLVFDAVSATGSSTTGISLSGTGGWTFSAAGGSIATTTNPVNLNGGSGAVSYAGNITNGTGEAVIVDNRSGSTTISGNITGTGGTGVTVSNSDAPGTTTFSGATKTLNTGAQAAVNLTSNTGHAIAFTNGGLDIDTTTGTGFNATGGGTVTVTTGVNPNTILATSGVGLNVANTTIGAGGLTFRSISAGNATAAADPANGIVLNSTGTAVGNGGLIVTGTGGTCTETTPTCTGGTIQNIVGADDSSFTPVGTGVVLNNTRAPSLTSMQIRDTSNYGVRGNQVTNLNLANSFIGGANGTNVATPFGEGSVSFDTVLGTNTITGSEIRGGIRRNVNFDHASGVGGGTTTINITNNNIHDTVGASPDDGIFVEAENNDNYTVNITGNSLKNHGGDHINVDMINSATIAVTISNNTLENPELPSRLGGGIFVFGASWNGTGTYTVSGNSIIRNRQGGAIHMNKGSGTASMSGTVSGNTIGITGVNKSGSIEASGIVIGARGAGGVHTTAITNNNVFGWNDRAIILEDGEGNAALNATVRGNTANTFDSVNGLHGVHADLGILAGDAGNVCLDIGGPLAADRNNLTLAGNEPAGGADIRLRRGSAVNLRLPGYAGGADDDAAVSAYLSGRNNVTSMSVTSPGTGIYSAAACATP